MIVLFILVASSMISPRPVVKIDLIRLQYLQQSATVKFVPQMTIGELIKQVLWGI